MNSAKSKLWNKLQIFLLFILSKLPFKKLLKPSNENQQTRWTNSLNLFWIMKRTYEMNCKRKFSNTRKKRLWLLTHFEKKLKVFWSKRIFYESSMKNIGEQVMSLKSQLRDSLNSKLNKQRRVLFTSWANSSRIWAISFGRPRKKQKYAIFWADKWMKA